MKEEQTPMEAAMVEAACDLHHSQGALEIDPDALVSLPDPEASDLDGGGFVQAWVWVDFSDLPDQGVVRRWLGGGS